MLQHRSKSLSFPIVAGIRSNGQPLPPCKLIPLLHRLLFEHPDPVSTVSSNQGETWDVAWAVADVDHVSERDSSPAFADGVVHLVRPHSKRGTPDSLINREHKLRLLREGHYGFW